MLSISTFSLSLSSSSFLTLSSPSEKNAGKGGLFWGGRQGGTRFIEYGYTMAPWGNTINRRSRGHTRLMASAGAAAAPSADAAPDPAARHVELEATRERRTKMYDLIARKEQEIEAIIRRNPGRRWPIPALAEHERGSSRAKTSVAQTTFGCANALLLLQRQRARTQCEKQNLRSSRNSDERKTAHEPALGM